MFSTYMFYLIRHEKLETCSVIATLGIQVNYILLHHSSCPHLMSDTNLDMRERERENERTADALRRNIIPRE